MKNEKVTVLTCIVHWFGLRNCAHYNELKGPELSTGVPNCQEAISYPFVQLRIGLEPQSGGRPSCVLLGRARLPAPTTTLPGRVILANTHADWRRRRLV
eukprot:SAG31_NODE_28743_length_405_cov_1.509804_1_plen_98_part_01